MFSLSGVPNQLFMKLYLLLIGGCVLYQAGTDAWTRERLARHGRPTQATVMGLLKPDDVEMGGFWLRLRFTTATGAVVWARSQYTYDALAYRVGQSVALRYDPRDPQVCLTEVERAKWYFLLNIAFTVPLFFFFRLLLQREP